MQVFADQADQIQAGMLRLHHHIQQNHCDLRLLGQYADRLSSRIGMQEFEGATEDLGIGQGEAGRLMHVEVVVNNQDAPARLRWIAITGVGLVVESEQIVFYYIAHLQALLR